MPLTPDQQTALVSLVRDTAREEIMTRFRNLSDSQVMAKTGPEDLVTEADLATEARLTVEISELLPGALVIGEEAVEADRSLLDGVASAERAVIIDPVDGTNNFATGLTTFGVILAVVERGETVFGLLFDPVMDDWVMARRGGGAWYAREGGAPRRLGPYSAQPASLSRAWVNLAIYPDAEARAAVLPGFAGFARVSSMGCSCHEYRQMARGHVHATVSPTAKLWDHAAGALVIEEIGGTATNGAGRRWTPADPVAPITLRIAPGQAVPC
ncbi:inositol monophosphatase (plasmid) [Thioclava sp. 'Guangxiensis']|uniref:inositol monophosphatase family protein n=1 Tax=Thioclava sp. 'Guangxiensis' TaxID=3149044 RepID=UPI0032C46615